MTDSPIDVVYFWCDGSDPAFARRRAAAAVMFGIGERLSNDDSGYLQAGELRYSVASVRRHMPWVRDVVVVTDGQDPGIPGVRLVNHSDVFAPDQLPCFNPYVLEAGVLNVPGLADRFILANDDTFVRKPVPPGFFFGEGTVSRFRIAKPDPACIYQSAIDRSYDLFNARFGTSYEHLLPHHNLDAYRRSSVERCVDAFRDEYAEFARCHFRGRDNLHRVLWNLYDMTFCGGRSKIVNDGSRPVDSIYLMNTQEDIETVLADADPALFCINDTRFSLDADRRRTATVLCSLFSGTQTKGNEIDT